MKGANSGDGILRPHLLPTVIELFGSEEFWKMRVLQQLKYTAELKASDRPDDRKRELIKQADQIRKRCEMNAKFCRHQPKK